MTDPRSHDTPRGCDVLPPMTPPVDRKGAASVSVRSDQPNDATTKRRSAGRFGVLNRFADEGARLTDTTAQACWWILYRETKPDGLATISHQRVAECVGVARKTVTRAVGRLEAAGLLTVVRHGGWQRGPNTYRVHATPKAAATKGSATKGSATKGHGRPPAKGQTRPVPRVTDDP